MKERGVPATIHFSLRGCRAGLFLRSREDPARRREPDVRVRYHDRMPVVQFSEQLLPPLFVAANWEVHGLRRLL